MLRELGLWAHTCLAASSGRDWSVLEIGCLNSAVFVSFALCCVVLYLCAVPVTVSFPVLAV